MEMCTMFLDWLITNAERGGNRRRVFSDPREIGRIADVNDCCLGDRLAFNR